MERKKKIVTLFSSKILNYHLVKDLGMVPYTFTKIFDFNSELVVFENKKENYSYLENEVKGLKLSFIKRGLKIAYLNIYFSTLSYLFKNSKNIDILNLYHFGFDSIIYGIVYKKINPKGKLYLKLDTKTWVLKENLEVKNKNRFWWNSYKLKFRLYFIKKILDIASYENISSKNEIKEAIPEFFSKFIHIPNGVSNKGEDKVFSFNEKENIIITVGRIGTYEKDNQKLLKVISEINLKNWKVFFIGPVEKKFEKEIDDYFEQNQNLKDKVLITDKEELFTYYNRAKVFCLTSRFEGFALVFPEALYARNYILTTNVGGAEDITKFGEIGYIFNDDIELKNRLKEIISEKINIEDNYYLAKEYSKNFFWDVIFEKYADKFN